MESFTDRIALVTGGASGIGFGIAKALLREGARVVIADLRADHLEDAERWAARVGQADHILMVELDVTDRAAMAGLADLIDERFGGLDILVNNAGVGIQGPFDQATFADWDFGLAVNLGGVVNGIQTFVPRMKARKRGGHIVNTSSLAGLAIPPADLAIYATAKAAVVALTTSLADHLAEHDIGISVLCPGLVRSNIHEIAQNRPARFQHSRLQPSESDAQSERRAADTSWLEPEAVGEMVIDGIRTNARYIITHPQHRATYLSQVDDVMAAWPMINR